MWGEDNGVEPARFRIVRQLGHGSTATVSLAVCADTGQRVALKTLKPEVAADARYLRHFQREADILRHVASDHVVRFVASGERNGPEGVVPYLAMEVLDGVTLDTLLGREGALPAPMVARVLAQILRGLGDLHRAGVVLRDPAMDNVMVLGWGHGEFLVKLIDLGANKPFGPAARADSTLATEELPESEWLLQGRYRYTPPEFSDGARHSIASDLYAIGLIGFELATDSRAVVADSVLELTRAFQAAGASMLSESRQGSIPDELFAVLRKLCATDPSERYLSAESARLALESWLAEVAPRPEGVGPHSHRTLRLPNVEPAPVDTNPVRPPTPRFSWQNLRELGLILTLTFSLFVIAVLILARPDETPAALPNPQVVTPDEHFAQLARLEGLIIEERDLGAARVQALRGDIEDIGRSMLLQCPQTAIPEPIAMPEATPDPGAERPRARRKKKKRAMPKADDNRNIISIDRDQIRKRKNNTQGVPGFFVP